MKRFLAGVLLATQFSMSFGADLSPKDVAALDATMDQSNAAFYRSDAEGIADVSSERLIQAVGGRGKHIEDLQGVMATIRAQGIQVVSHHTDPPSAPISADGFIVTVVKEKTILESHGRRIRNDGFTVAVRPTAGGAWKLIGGGGVAQNPGVISMLYPGFPVDYKFPPYTMVPM
jgi:hypothetical protein